MAQEPSASGTPGKGDTVATMTATTSKSDETAPGDRKESASKLVDRFAIWSGVAGIIPVPVVDLIAVGGLQLQMLRRLSQIYDVPFSKNRGKSLIASLAGSAIPASSAAGAASLLKGVPVLGTAISTVVMPALSAGATYAIGKTFIQHFESGGTLLDFNPPDYREFLKSHREMWDSRATKSGGAAKSDSTGRTDTSAGAAATSS
jgi:uncharacterized protein (DUF697 family)